MRNAKIIAESVLVVCPHCGEPKAEPQGSLLWEPRDLERGGQTFLVCYSCARPFNIPAKVRVSLLAGVE